MTSIMIILSNSEKIDTTTYKILESLKFLLFISKFWGRIDSRSIFTKCRTCRRIAFLSIVMRLISFFACILCMHGRLQIAVLIETQLPPDSERVSPIGIIMFRLQINQKQHFTQLVQNVFTTLIIISDDYVVCKISLSLMKFLLTLI